jgi:hydrogenase maturation protease
MPKTLVLGLGNLLLSDEGFGVQAVARLRDRFTFPDDVELMDGGTAGLALLPALEDADRILVLDVVELKRPPGTLARLSWDDLPRALQIKVSPHQETAQEAFGMLEFRRGRPQAFEVVGVQPGSLELGLELSPPVEAAMEPALRRAVETLRVWGHAVEAR